METLIDERDETLVADIVRDFFQSIIDLFRQRGRRAPASHARPAGSIWRQDNRRDNYMSLLNEMESYRKRVRRELDPEAWSTIAPTYKRAQREVEALSRRSELQHAVDEDELRKSIYWMYAQGQGVELNSLQKVKDAYQTRLKPKTLELIEEAEQQITARIMEEGEQAFERHREQWERRYADQYIAIAGSDVAAADYSYDGLVEQIERLADERRVFFPYVREVRTRLMELPYAPRPAAADDETPQFLSGHVLRAGHDLRLPDGVPAVGEDGIRAVSPESLTSLFDDVRYMLGYFPLTIVVDGWEHAAARQFWQAAQALRETRDRVWLLGRGAGQVEGAVCLDMDEDSERSLAQALVADLLFVTAADGVELDARLTKWGQRTLVVIVAAPDLSVLQGHDQVGLPHLRFAWPAG